MHAQLRHFDIHLTGRLSIDPVRGAAVPRGLGESPSGIGSGGYAAGASAALLEDVLAGRVGAESDGATDGEDVILGDRHLADQQRPCEDARASECNLEHPHCETFERRKPL